MAKAEAAKEIRRTQLIDATMRAIGRYGYASLTLTPVAGEAGLSPGIVRFDITSSDHLVIAGLQNSRPEYSALSEGAVVKGKVAPAVGLEAIIHTDCAASVYNPEKASIWYAISAAVRNNRYYQH